MALAAVGGAFLSSFFDVDFDRLASLEVVNLIRGKNLDKKLLQKIITKLEDIVVRLKSLLRLKESLDLKKIAVENNVPWKVPSTSLEDGSNMVGIKTRRP
ncbi:hypothetical protein Fmac_012308 [Flemingia macrophylla]|uniref:Uncharacterized protein n=1 Tax=Flemingia macrophylla TaxID=520843 RepID=A0ABD1MQR5_9FABA